ncbi:MAG TPA: class I SAM-dependent methyltransferase [Thermoanaerobaculia bacterium]|nr:class I SAM-dependent methyltransferase [Thermoanaerobaculia bacterium]
MSVPSTAADYFGDMVESYDSRIRRAVPRYDEMIERLIDYLPPAADRVLELGCGTGNLSLSLAERYPSAKLTLVDASPEMLNVTRKRLSRQATFVESLFEQLPATLGQFDVVVSSISLHHVRDKSPLYERIAQLTDEGGTFRFADQLRGGTEENHAINWERWLEFCRSAGHCSDAETSSLVDHAAAHDHYTPLAEHFAMLQAAGFTKLDCVWRNWIWGIVTAER